MMFPDPPHFMPIDAPASLPLVSSWSASEVALASSMVDALVSGTVMVIAGGIAVIAVLAGVAYRQRGVV